MMYQYSEELLQNIDKLRQALLDDLHFFFYYGFARVHNKIAEKPNPEGRIDHFRIMADEIMSALRGEKAVLNINLPPRYGKTELMCFAIAWCYAHNPSANNIYVSYKKMLASVQTELVRQIMSSDFYLNLFDARISKSSSAKDNFLTVQGGRTIAVGTDGSALGSGAGVSDDVPYGGAIWIDDIMKAQDLSSDAMKNNATKLYAGTLIGRRNNPNKTPIINTAQRIDIDDFTGRLLHGKPSDDFSSGDNGLKPLDIYQEQWVKNAVVIPALDKSGNALWPSKHSKEYLLKLKEVDPFTFYSQMQQDPISSMSKMFKSEKVRFTDKEPDIKATFITVDAAETVNEVNDASVFSMWGVYEVEHSGNKTGDLALHSIVCHSCRVEPQDLLSEFESFYMAAGRHKIKPRRVYIEKKSMGTMLYGQLKNRQGIDAIAIERKGFIDEGINSKSNRFKKAAPYVAMGLLSMNYNAPHRDMFIKEMESITHKFTQAHDDIMDTMADAIRLALEDRIIYDNKKDDKQSDIVSQLQRINRQRRLI